MGEHYGLVKHAVNGMSLDKLSAEASELKKFKAKTSGICGWDWFKLSIGVGKESKENWSSLL